MSLVTLADLKTFLGITDNSQDSLLTMFKESVEASIIAYCETDFTQKVVTNECYDATDSDIIVLKNYPVISIQKVTIGATNNSNGLDISASDFNFDDSSIILKFGQSTGFSRASIYVDYTYGYASVPSDVKMSVYQSVKAEMQRYSSNTENIQSRSKEGESESFGGSWDSLSGLPKQILSKLQHYKPLEFPLVNMAQRNY